MGHDGYHFASVRRQGGCRTRGTAQHAVPVGVNVGIASVGLGRVGQRDDQHGFVIVESQTRAK